MDLNTLFKAKLVALLREDDEMLNPIVKALQNKVESINANSRYLYQFAKDLHESDGLLCMDGKLVILFTLRNAVLKTLHDSHPGQFGKKYLAQYIWWPHINRQIYFHGINCTQCTQTGKNIKSIIPTTQVSELPALSEPNEEPNFDFYGPLDNNWGKNKYILLCIDRFSKFPSAKITSSTSSNTVIDFLQDYFYHHGIPNSLRVDHASCFTSQDFILFCNFFNIKLIFCTVGDHRSNGLVDKLVHTVKIKLLAMSIEQQRLTLQFAISKIVWNLRSSCQSKIKCSPFEIHFNRKPNTIWKQLASSNLSGGFLDKGKSILSKERAFDWNADDRIEDGYKDCLVPKKNQSPLEKGYDSDHPADSKPSCSRVSLKSLFKGNLLRKTNGSINGNLLYKQLGQKIINSTKSMVELSDGKIIRKSDIAIPKSKSSTIRSFKENNSFPSFINTDLQVGSRKTNKTKPQQTGKLGPKTRRQIELPTPVTTRSRGINQPIKLNKSKRTQNKASTSNTGYLAGDESMFIPSDTSDISDWE